jgi:hypothetical protein
MRITVEIEDSKVRAIQKMTRQRKKSPALVAALDEFIAFKRRQAFLAKVMAGETDYLASNEQVEAMARLERP